MQSMPVLETAVQQPLISNQDQNVFSSQFYTALEKFTAARHNAQENATTLEWPLTILYHIIGWQQFVQFFLEMVTIVLLYLKWKTKSGLLYSPAHAWAVASEGGDLVAGLRWGHSIRRDKKSCSWGSRCQWSAKNPDYSIV